MNPHHKTLLQRFQATEPGRGQTTQRAEHLGAKRRWYGLKNDQRRRVMLDFVAAQLNTWLAQLEGWAEVDSTCQSVFTAKDLLADWASWQALLESLALDDNINKQRAALVLLTAPITQSSDPRILELSLRLINQLKGEKDKRITKAVSWLLRKGIKQHRLAIADYLDANADALPAIAVRETRKKLLTGKK